MDARKRSWLLTGMATAILLATALMIILQEGVNTWTVISFAILVFIVLIAVFFVARLSRELKSGYPLEDERSKAINMRAGYLSFYISLYVMIGVAWVLVLLEDSGFTISASEMLFIMVVISGTLYLIFNYSFKRAKKGSPNEN